MILALITNAELNIITGMSIAFVALSAWAVSVWRRTR